jgi:hypothetical protein
MTETYQLALSEPNSELIHSVTQWSHAIGAMFSADEIYFISQALAALAKREKHPSIDLNAFISTTLKTCEAYRETMALILSIAQDRYTQGINP